MAVSIRPARDSDLSQIHEVYTHYVLNTSLTFLTSTPPLSFTVKKFENITQKRGLPFLVAVEELQGGGDVVVGYTSLSPSGLSFGYAATVELTLFLHPEKVGRGIGSRLLEEILGMVRKGEVWHAAREFEGLEGWEKCIEMDDMRGRVRNVVAIMAVDVERREEGEGLRRFYAGRGFVERGRMKGVGFKRGRW